MKNRCVNIVLAFGLVVLSAATTAGTFFDSAHWKAAKVLVIDNANPDITWHPQQGVIRHDYLSRAQLTITSFGDDVVLSESVRYRYWPLRQTFKEVFTLAAGDTLIYDNIGAGRLSDGTSIAEGRFYHVKDTR